MLYRNPDVSKKRRQSEPAIKCEPVIKPVKPPVEKPAQKPPKAPKKAFKPKHAWLTESADSFLTERIEAEKKRDLRIEPLAHRKLSRAILNRYEPVTKRKTVDDESLNDYDERYCIKQRIKRKSYKNKFFQKLQKTIHFTGGMYIWTTALFWPKWIFFRKKTGRHVIFLPKWNFWPISG